MFHVSISIDEENTRGTKEREGEGGRKGDLVRERSTYKITSRLDKWKSGTTVRLVT